MSDRYARIRAALREHPWAILPSMLDLVVEIVDRRIDGIDLSAEEIDARIEAARRPATAPVAAGNVAVLPIYGVLAHRMHLFTNVSKSGTSTEALTLAFRAAIADPSVAAIVLDVDTPGGSVFGVQELAGEIAAARGTKPIAAVANSLAASAGYWIASQAEELVVTPGGQVGSIGVLAIHDDVSQAAEQQGLKRTYISAGKFKAEGHGFAPLADEARQEIQRVVDAYYDRFVRAVAAGRKASLTTVRETFGQGRLVLSSDAVAAGMADREETLQQTIDRLVGRQAKARGSRANSPAADTELEHSRARLRLAEAARPGGA